MHSSSFYCFQPNSHIVHIWSWHDYMHRPNIWSKHSQNGNADYLRECRTIICKHSSYKALQQLTSLRLQIPSIGGKLNYAAPPTERFYVVLVTQCSSFTPSCNVKTVARGTAAKFSWVGINTEMTWKQDNRVRRPNTFTNFLSQATTVPSTRLYSDTGSYTTGTH